MCLDREEEEMEEEEGDEVLFEMEFLNTGAAVSWFMAGPEYWEIP